jgi:hypothetical protein
MVNLRGPIDPKTGVYSGVRLEQRVDADSAATRRTPLESTGGGGVGEAT